MLLLKETIYRTIICENVQLFAGEQSETYEKSQTTSGVQNNDSDAHKSVSKIRFLLVATSLWFQRKEFQLKPHTQNLQNLYHSIAN